MTNRGGVHVICTLLFRLLMSVLVLYMKLNDLFLVNLLKNRLNN